VRRSWLGAIGCVALFSLSCGAGQLSPTVSEPLAGKSTASAVITEPTPEATKARTGNASEGAHVEALVEYLGDQPTGLTSAELRDLAVAITEEVARQRIDLHLILAVMYVESRFKPFAVSPVGAMGLMQILPATGEEVARAIGIEWYGPETLFDPVVNVRIGITYVKKLTKRYEKVSTALAAYNWGMGTIDKRLRGGRPVPRVYPGLVMDAYNRTVPAVRS